jgi:hypothetical protein
MQDKSPASLFARMLIQLDVFPVGALLRAGVGYALMPTLRYVLGPGSSDWRIVPWFIAVLVSFRVLPAVLRTVVRFPPTTRTVWVERRVLAKRFDSYQWRKLVWFGVGMAANAAIWGDFDAVPLAFTAAVIVAGCLGEYAWRRYGAPIVASERQ